MHLALVHPTPNLQRALDEGLSGMAPVLAFLDAGVEAALDLPPNAGLAGEPRGGRTGRCVFSCEVS